MKLRKIVSMLLVLLLVVSVLPREALALGSVRYWLETPPMEAHDRRTASATPQLSAGNHQHYQDRLSNMPDYAMDFYAWLEHNATAEGALADPTLGDAYGPGYYYYQVTVISGTETVTVPTGADREALATNVAQEAMNRELGIFSNYANTVYSVFDREHPEVFWLSGSAKFSAMCGYDYTGVGKNCTVYYELYMLFWLQAGSFDIRSSNYPTKAAVAEGIKVRDAAVEEILAGCTETDPAEQVRYLNEVLVLNNAYNRAVAEGRNKNLDPDIRECISALEGRAGDRGPVCEGYARAFMLLCQKLGIPCVLSDGKARNRADMTPEDHMWNLVQLDGAWYAVDLTWNDPYVLSRPEQKASGYESEDWLLLGVDSPVGNGLTFVQSHIETNDICGNGICFTNGPVLASDVYVPKVGFVLSGTVTSYGDKTAPVTLELLGAGEPRTVTATDGAYSFADVVPGSYTLKVSKTNHVTRSYTVTVEADSIQDVKICLLGDVTGDGRVNVADTSKVYTHVKGGALLTDYAFACADVDGNGRINVADTSKVYSHVKGSKLLW